MKIVRRGFSHVTYLNVIIIITKYESYEISHCYHYHCCCCCCCYNNDDDDYYYHYHYHHHQKNSLTAFSFPFPCWRTRLKNSWWHRILFPTSSYRSATVEERGKSIVTSTGPKLSLYWITQVIFFSSNAQTISYDDDNNNNNNIKTIDVLHLTGGELGAGNIFLNIYVCVCISFPLLKTRWI